MKINEEEFNKSAKLLKGVKLSESEKATMLSNIYQTETVNEPRPVASPFVFSSIFMRERLTVVMASLVLIVASSGYAAAGSLPGDPLYGIKVNILEPLALQLTFDEAAKNEYKMELLQKRIAELQALRLNAEINSESEAESYYAAERIISELEASAVFDESGTNVKIETNVQTYNSLISEPFHLKTRMLNSVVAPEEINLEDVRDAKDPQYEKNEPLIKKDIENVKDEVQNVVTETKKPLEEVERAVWEVQADVEEGTEEIKAGVEQEVSRTVKEVVDPITKGLGF